MSVAKGPKDRSLKPCESVGFLAGTPPRRSSMSSQKRIWHGHGVAGAQGNVAGAQCKVQIASDYGRLDEPLCRRATRS